MKYQAINTLNITYNYGSNYISVLRIAKVAYVTSTDPKNLGHS